MHATIIILILLGAMLMIYNIIRYVQFMRNSHDVLSAGSKRDTA